MENIFHDYDLYSYVGNLIQVLNEENINFFITYSIKNYKLYTCFIYCLIHGQYNLLHKIIDILKANTITDTFENANIFNLKESNNNEMKQIIASMTYYSFLQVLFNFLIDYFADFDTFNIQTFLQENLYVILKDDSLCKQMSSYLNINLK